MRAGGQFVMIAEAKASYRLPRREPIPEKLPGVETNITPLFTKGAASVAIGCAGRKKSRRVGGAEYSSR